jgi:hypothetical protein
MENKNHQRYEARHAIASETRYSLKKKLTAAALVLTSASAIGAGLNQRGEDSRREHIAVAEKYIGSNIDKVTASVSPDYTLVLPNITPSSTMISETWALPNEEELKKKGQWCDTPDVPLYEYANPEQMEAASKIEMGLSTSAYEALSDEILGATDRAQVENMVEGVYERLGVKATFDETRDDFVATDKPKLLDNGDTEEVRAFAAWMTENLKALTYMPKEMAQLPASIDFVEADALATRSEVDGKEELRGLDGQYRSKTKQIIIRVGSEAWVTVHEFGHAAQDEACPGVFGSKATSDGEMEQVHTKARTLAEANKDANDIKDEWPKNMDGGYKRYFNDYRKLTGFPTDYSLSAQAEFFADETAALLMKGQVNVYNSERTPEQVSILQRMVVERLEKAMPGVDFRSLVAARAQADLQSRDSDIPLQALIANHVSSIDRTFVSSYDKLVYGDKLEPALKIMTLDGHNETYIYCKKSDLRKTAEGDLGGQYSIALNKTGNKKFDQRTLDTSLKYLKDLGYDKQIDLDFEVRLYPDSVYVIANVAKSGSADATPDIRYVDYTKDETGTGG